jgi:hypothetical protein
LPLANFWNHARARLRIFPDPRLQLANFDLVGVPQRATDAVEDHPDDNFGFPASHFHNS